MISLAQFKDKTQKSGAVNWPSTPPLESLWAFEMKAPREDVWAYLSDTSRFNRELGLSKRTEEERDGKVHVTTTMLGLVQKWIEEPWTWIAGYTIASKRTYQQGLAEKVHAVFDIAEENPETRTVYIYFGWTPKNAFWAWFLKVAAPMLKGKFAAAFAKIDAHVTQAGERRMANALKKDAPEIPEKGMKLLGKHREQLLAKNLDSWQVNALCDWIATADDMEIEGLRLRPLARKWNTDQRKLLTTFLHAAQGGLLKLTWKVMCPHCRGPRFSAESLGDIPTEAKCDTCELEFATNNEDAVEVIFHVHPAVRMVTPALYCAAEPAKKPHIKIQQQVEPGAEFRVNYSFTPGNYRVRVIGRNKEFKIHAEWERAGATIDCNAAQDAVNAGFDNELVFRNQFNEAVLFVVESLWWEADILKPVDVFSNNEFRTLFSQEHLSANVNLHLGEQALLFTDVVGSTVFYNEVGDAKAFAEIRAHFQQVFKAVKDHNGVVVKTIGDAVMASFPSIHDALDGAVAIQKCFPEERTDSPIRLRISVHNGQVMAVHLNSGIDYFGSAVNFTAKIQSAAGANEIAMSKEVYEEFLAHFGQQTPGFTLKKHQERREYLNITDIYVVKVHGKAISKAA